jgi:hypothetical protein
VSVAGCFALALATLPLLALSSRYSLDTVKTASPRVETINEGRLLWKRNATGPRLPL